MDTMDTKICKTCNIEQPIINYKKYRNLVYNTCKKCVNERDKILKKNVRIKNLETLTICEICNQTKKLYDFAKLKKFYKKHICLECYPNFLIKQKIDWDKKKNSINPNYRIKKSIASHLRAVLTKTDTTMNYIGCNIQYLREWFEYNFIDEMNWNNYGKYWSIEHIIPISKFDLTNEKEKLICWNWSNLVPLKINYNSSKKKEIDLNQVNNILKKLEKFKEEGSTTKWFSEEFILNLELVMEKNV